MAWSNPRTWTLGELVTPAHMNTEVRDNLNALPRGQLGYAQITSSQTGLTDTTITGLSVTVTVPANRRIRITGCGSVQTLDAGAQFFGQIRQDGGVDVGSWHNFRAATAGQRLRSQASTIITPSAGERTWTLRLARVAGTGNANFEASSVQPGFILVEDIGSSV